MEELNLEAMVKYARESVNRVIGAAVLLEQSCEKEKDLVSELVNSACRLLTQNINLSYMCCDALYTDSRETIDCGAVLDSVIEEAVCILTAAGRDISFKSANIGGVVRIDSKAFIIIVVNLLQNALFYSPKETIINVKLESRESEKEAVITIENEILPDAPPERSGIGLPLVKKITEWHGGVFEHENNGKTFTARLTFPLIKANPKTMLNSSKLDYCDYVSERFKPVNLFLNETLFH